MSNPKGSLKGKIIKVEVMNQTKTNLLAALEQTLGVVAPACKMIGMSRSVHYQYMKDDPEYRSSVIELTNVCLDYAETKLFQLMEAGNAAAVIFYLKTKGKKRGYVETLELTLPNIQVIHEGNKDLHGKPKLGRLHNGESRRDKIIEDV